ncbi:MAG: hypothetical protein KKG33_11430 [candidate division Zixibacteria bacterium]|nr:hypothetical protein [candidate division Zixibacteria bacterium]
MPDILLDLVEQHSRMCHSSGQYNPIDVDPGLITGTTSATGHPPTFREFPSSIAIASASISH